MHTKALEIMLVATVVEIIEFLIFFETFCILIAAIFPRLKLVIITTDNKICKIKKFPYFSKPKYLR